MNLRRRLACFLTPLALLAAGEASASVPRLVAPVAGQELTAGSLAVVEWEGQPPIEEAEEWEAFLSLDGGRTHPLRITPHLDLSVRRFTFRVPAFPTRDARFLLRFGDERHEEVEVETPHRFTIVAGRGGVSFASRISLSRGERARSGEDGVVFWVEGARDGSGLREVMAEEADLAFRSVETGRLPGLLVLMSSPQRASLAAPAVPFRAQRTPPRKETGPSPSALERPPVRLLISRFNE